MNTGKPPVDRPSARVAPASPTSRFQRFWLARSRFYLLCVLTVIVVGGLYSFRSYGIFRCSALGYGSDRYLGYCGATDYGDYDHGAFWFDLEPAAVNAARDAKVLFVGNSRLQFGLSTAATSEWFAAVPAEFYLLGFSHNGNYRFEAPLLQNLRPKAKVYIINVDLFFERSESGPARTVMRDGGAKARCEQKRTWQWAHEALCKRVSFVCGRGITYFRSRSTGAWIAIDPRAIGRPVTYDRIVDAQVVEAYSTAGKGFLSELGGRRECTILTIVPTVKTDIGTAVAIAEALGVRIVAPDLPGLTTFDDSHLDPPSAERWSNAFFAAAGDQIRKCLSETPGTLAGSSKAR